MQPFHRDQRPRLLVSVRNAIEAEIALAGGCELLDFKDPLLGAMAPVDPQILLEGVAAAQCCNPTVPISVALGELKEWESTATTAILASVSDSITYCKVGSAGIDEREDWRRHWCDLMTRVSESHLRQQLWIAVAYADYQRAASLPLADIVQLAIEQECDGLLIDTFDKSSGRLTDCIDRSTLHTQLSKLQKAGLHTAIAGRLRAEEIPDLCDLPVNIIGVRSAACSDGTRTSTVDASRINQLITTRNTAMLRVES